MKLQAKKSAFTNSLCVYLGYCEAENLLRFSSPIAYTSGVYGWNADIYEFSVGTGVRVFVVTGYRPFGERTSDYKTLRDYEKRATEIVHNWNISGDAQRRRVTTLLRNWLRKECKTLSENKKSKFYQFAECFK